MPRVHRSRDPGDRPRLVAAAAAITGFGWSCGMVVGLIQDIPTVAGLVQRIISEAESIVRSRLTGLLDGLSGLAPSLDGAPGRPAADFPARG
jgi:hypothetical protein